MNSVESVCGDDSRMIVFHIVVRSFHMADFTLLLMQFPMNDLLIADGHGGSKHSAMGK